MASFPEIRDRTVVVNGVSKGFAMTGWRIGYIMAPVWIAELAEKYQGQVTSGTSSISQRAALAALKIRIHRIRTIATTTATTAAAAHHRRCVELNVAHGARRAVPRISRPRSCRHTASPATATTAATTAAA